MRFTASPAAASARSPASKRSTSTAKIHCNPSPQAAVCQRMDLRLVDNSHATGKMVIIPRNPVNSPKRFSLPHQFEAVGTDPFEAIVFPARLAAEDHSRGGQHELT